MAYSSFPDIQKPSYQYDITLEDPGLASDMDDGSVVSRARFTRTRSTYAYKWNAMSSADWATLLTFYKDTVKGCSQICTFNSVDGRIYDLKASAIGNSRFSVSMTFEEA